jgi:hypothetical protein
LTNVYGEGDARLEGGFLNADDLAEFARLIWPTLIA